MATKVISFFNGKGGTGKTLLNVLFASYLQYGCGKKTAVVDFEAPNFPVKWYKERDAEILMDENSELSVYLREHGYTEGPSWDAIGFNASKDRSLEDSYKRFMALVSSGEYDYVITDFPSNFQTKSIEGVLLASKCLDYVVIPTDISRTSRRWAYTLTKGVLEKVGIPYAWLWNNLSWYDGTQGPADIIQKGYEKEGIPFAPIKVKTFAKARRESDSKYFVVSTLCWPEENVKRYIPELIPLFEWVKAQLDESK